MGDHVDQVVVDEQEHQERGRARRRQGGETEDETDETGEVRQQEERHHRYRHRRANGSVRAAHHVHEGLAVRLPEVRHLLAELLEEPAGLALADRLDALLPGEAVLLDSPGHGPVLVVHLLPRDPRVPLPQVQRTGGGDGHEGPVRNPVAQGPGGDGEERGDHEGRGTPRTTRAPPGEPRSGQGEEVEDRLAREDGEAEQEPGDDAAVPMAPFASAATSRSRPHQRSTVKTVSTQKWAENQTSSG